MSRITGTDARSLMEAYNAVYTPQINEDYLWESYLTEEFISEAYQTVADYLVHNGFVPGYNTAEVYMSEMAVEDIDSILFETGVLNEQYLIEAGFFQNAANAAIGGVKRATSAVAGGVRSAAGGADRAVGGAVRAGQTAVGTVKRAGQAAVGAVKADIGNKIKAGQAVVGGAQRAAGAVQKAVTPVAQAVQGTAQRAVSAGQSALGGAAKAVQGAAQGAVRASTGAVAGGVKKVGGAIASGSAAVGGAANAAVRKVGQEVEISRKVGAGEPLKVGPKIVGPKIVGTGPRNFGSKAMAEKNKQGALTASFDMFDTVLEYLVAEGYADTNEAAISIMANMSEDWREGIVEAQEARNNPEKYEKEPGKKKSKKQAMDDPHTGINSPAFNAFMRKQMGR
jgi:hypothetical protein